MCTDLWGRAGIAETGITYAESASNLTDNSEVCEEPKMEHSRTEKLDAMKRRAARIRIYRKRSKEKYRDCLLPERGGRKSWKPSREIEVMPKVGTVFATRWECERNFREYMTWCATYKVVNINKRAVKQLWRAERKMKRENAFLSPTEACHMELSLFSAHGSSRL